MTLVPSKGKYVINIFTNYLIFAFKVRTRDFQGKEGLGLAIKLDLDWVEEADDEINEACDLQKCDVVVRVFNGTIQYLQQTWSCPILQRFAP